MGNINAILNQFITIQKIHTICIHGVAAGYTPVVNAAVLSVYRHVTDVAMLALVAVRAVVAVAIVGLAIISALAVKAVHKWLERYSREWCAALVWEVRRGVHW